MPMEDVSEKLTQVNSIFRRFFHDARTNLTVIGGYVSVMLEGDAGEITPEQRDYLNIIHRSVGKLQGVTEEISDFMLFWSGLISPKKATTDLKNLLLESVKSIDHFVRKKGIIIEYDITLKEAPVFADSAIMSKAIAYLMGDYLKLLPTSSKVRVSLVPRGDDFYVAFKDNALELTTDRIPLIFQGFYQNDKAASDDDRELGLGFPIARHIIELNDGKIWMEADPSGRSSISFTLPIRKEEDRAKVLIVEDNEFIARLWADKLRKAEYTVILAASSGAGLDMARSEKPSVIILDVMIPGGMDGFEVCLKLKEIDELRSVPILIVSNLWQENLVEKAKSAGATEFIAKSRISPGELLDRVKKLLEKEQQKKELQKKV